MKTCNNCGHQNHLSAIVCISCNMTGQFTYQDAPGASGNLSHHSIDCINCGQENPADSIKCYVCHFPIGKKKDVAVQLKNEEWEKPSFLEISDEL
ncbi:MAG: hypothetical protein AAFV80_10080 [Bacteroidota bacterium]